MKKHMDINGKSILPATTVTGSYYLFSMLFCNAFLSKKCH